MSNTNTGGPAFPVGSGDMRDPTGMTLRDYFAAKALQIAADGNLAEGEYFVRSDRFGDVALDAYKMADAMLKARES